MYLFILHYGNLYVINFTKSQICEWTTFLNFIELRHNLLYIYASVVYVCVYVFICTFVFSCIWLRRMCVKVRKIINVFVCQWRDFLIRQGVCNQIFLQKIVLKLDLYSRWQCWHTYYRNAYDNTLVIACVNVFFHQQNSFLVNIFQKIP